MIDRSRLNEELRKMKTLIQQDPAVKGRFDTDGSGDIDGEEWEQVRRLVIQRLEREETEAEEARRLAAEAGQDPTAVGGGSIGGIAEEIYNEDLSTPPGGASTSGLSGCEDLVLTQEGGFGQFIEGMMRREYSIASPDGQVLGVVRQVENQMLNELNTPSIFERPDLNFSVMHIDGGQAVTFRRSEGLASKRMDILDEVDGQMGYVTWKPGLIHRSYRIVSTLDSGFLEMKTFPFRPFTLDVLNGIGEKIGTLRRGWSGLSGFLTGGNRMRIHLTPGATSLGQRWALLAAALLEDLSAEERKSS